MIDQNRKVADHPRAPQLGAELQMPQRIYKVAPEETRAIVSDLDGTLLVSGRKLPQSARQTLQEIEQGGRQVVLASARPPRSVLEIQQELGIHGLVVALNGAWIGDTQGKTHTYTLSESVVDHLISITSTLDAATFAYTSELWFASKLDDHWCKHESQAVGFSPDARFTDESFHPFRTEILKIVVTSYPEVVARIRESLTGMPCCATSSGPRFLEVVGLHTTPAGDYSPVGKLTAVQTVLAASNLKLSDALMLGDGENDALLLAAAGCGVSFSKAHTEAIAAADQIIERHPQETVIPFLRKVYNLR